MIEGQIMDKIYHGCATRYSNRKRKLFDFEKGKLCLILMSQPFLSKEIPTESRLQTRSSTKRRQLIKGPFKVVK